MKFKTFIERTEVSLSQRLPAIKDSEVRALAGRVRWELLALMKALEKRSPD